MMCATQAASTKACMHACHHRKARKDVLVTEFASVEEHPGRREQVVGQREVGPKLEAPIEI